MTSCMFRLIFIHHRTVRESKNKKEMFAAAWRTPPTRPPPPFMRLWKLPCYFYFLEQPDDIYVLAETCSWLYFYKYKFCLDWVCYASRCTADRTRICHLKVVKYCLLTPTWTKNFYAEAYNNICDSRFEIKLSTCVYFADRSGYTV
jgi:hypothetical protein